MLCSLTVLELSLESLTLRQQNLSGESYIASDTERAKWSRMPYTKIPNWKEKYLLIIIQHIFRIFQFSAMKTLLQDLISHWDLHF